MSTIPHNKPIVLHLPSWFPSESDPLNGVFIDRHIQQIALDGHFQHVVMSIHNNASAARIAVETINGVTYLRYYYAPNTIDSKVAKILKLYLWAKGYWTLKKTYEKMFAKPVLLHVHVIWRAGFAALFFKKIWNIPLAVTEHWSGYQLSDGSYKGVFMKWVTKKVVKAAAGVHTISHDLAKAMQQHGLMNQYIYIPNSADDKVFQHTNRKKSVDFIHVSNFVPEKRPLAIIEAFYAALKLNANLTLNFVGEGPLLNACKALVNQLEINHAVHFLGKLVDPLLVADAMDNSKALVLFSAFEGLPCVMVEAWFAGIPVITTAVGGIPEVMTTATGILLKNEDKTALTTAFLQFNGSDYSSKIIREYALNNFSKNAVSQSFNEWYLNQIINK